MGTWLRRLAYILRQSRYEADLRDEIESHRSLHAAHLERQGLTPVEAERASRRAVGNVMLAREDAREVWLGSWDTWWQDIRDGVRTLRRNPTFTVVAIVTLALGIGINAGMFTVVNAVLFRDIPAPRAHELVSISQRVQGVPERLVAETFSTAEYVAYRDGAKTLTGLAAYGNARGEPTLGGDTPLRLLGMLVSCNYFDVLEQPPALGRALVERDCQPGAAPVVMLSHDLWRTAFRADPAVVGRTIQLNRRQVTVAGVTARGTYNGSPFVGGGFFAPLNAGVWLGSDTRHDDPAAAWLTLMGRRRQGVELASVQAEVDVLGAQLDRQRPGQSTTLTVERPTPSLPGQVRGRAGASAAVVMAAFGAILLIACANVGNLLLARGPSRSHELAVRASLGASRPRIVRQLVTESVLMAAAAGVFGTVATVWLFQSLVSLALPALLPPWLPLALTIDLSPDTRVFSFAAAATAVAALMFGLAPALHLSRSDVHAATRQGAASVAGGARNSRLQGLLVGVQVALCMVLIVAAGLLLRGLYATYTIDPGFEYRDVALVTLETAFDGYTEEEAETARARLMESFAAQPGVEAVASAEQEPLGDDVSPVMLRLRGEAERDARVGELTAVAPNYFSVLEIPMVRGRTFTEEEATVRRPGVRPAIVSATTARNLWPDGDPIGQTLLAARPGLPDADEALQVVGVAADAQLEALGRVDPYYVYVPGAGSAVLIKSRATFAATAAGIRNAIARVDPTLVVSVLPLEATLGWSRGISGTVTALFGGLGLLALVLAGVGVYGVVSYAVTRRYREIGIRLALGARARDVASMILRQTMRPVAVGAGAGVAGAAAVSGVLASVLFGISPADPAGFGGAALFVLAVALAAAAVAARPVVGVDSTVVLRYE